MNTETLKTISPSEAKEILSEFTTPSQQRALCCVLGAYAGDNLGNFNEFELEIDETELEEAMQMLGGGCQSLIPGQSTDDSELATALGYGLIESNSITNNPHQKESMILNCNLIAKYFDLWRVSEPFNSGTTVSAALVANEQEGVEEQWSAEQCQKAMLAQQSRYSAFLRNKNSQNNGGLARITPLVVFLSHLEDEIMIRRAVFAEQTLTHSSNITLETSFIYSLICIKFIQGKSATEVIDHVQKYFDSQKGEDSEVKSWWKDSLKQKTISNAGMSMSWIKHSILQCFIILRQIKEQEQSNSLEKQNLYKQSIKQSIFACGDSNTNAAIVGGMVGAYLTLDQFPTDYLEKIINCDLQDENNEDLKNPRPELFNPRNSIFICQQILHYQSQSQEHKIIQIIDEKISQSTEQLIKQKQNNKNQYINTRVNKEQQYLADNSTSITTTTSSNSFSQFENLPQYQFVPNPIQNNQMIVEQQQQQQQQQLQEQEGTDNSDSVVELNSSYSSASTDLSTNEPTSIVNNLSRMVNQGQLSGLPSQPSQYHQPSIQEKEEETGMEEEEEQKKEG